MRYLVGLDDTDDLESRGTGHRARQLGDALAREGLEPLGVTRHQLLVDSRIPCTSHNSSACIEVRGAKASLNALMAISREFLRECSAPGSDAGLCVAPLARIDGPIVAFGERAKRAIVTVADAERLAAAEGVHLEALTGTGLGVIGALAAAGLRAGGDDGRFLWLPRLREISGVHLASELRDLLGLDAVETEDGRPAGDRDRIAVGDWPRPLLRKGRRVLLIQEADCEEYKWSVAARERIKQLSS